MHENGSCGLSGLYPPQGWDFEPRPSYARNEPELPVRPALLLLHTHFQSRIFAASCRRFGKEEEMTRHIFSPTFGTTTHPGGGRGRPSYSGDGHPFQERTVQPPEQDVPRKQRSRRRVVRVTKKRKKKSRTRCCDGDPIAKTRLTKSPWRSPHH